jgi:hypothetical protein
MICLCDEPPLIKIGGGAVALDLEWLQYSLEKAALAAGYPQWWPATEVARTVTLYLKALRSEEPFSLEGFRSTVRTALQGIGYSEVAPHFLRDGLEIAVSLLEIAEGCIQGFELEFFERCSKTCEHLLTTGLTSRIAIEDLTPAVKRMLGRINWCGQCQQMADELVALIRHRIFQFAEEKPLYFSIR